MSRIYKTATATQYIRASVVAANDDGSVDPTVFPVSMAFTFMGSIPGSEDWQAAEWVTDSNLARVKVGPEGDFDLAATDWSVWVQVITDDETVQSHAGYLTVE